MHKHCNAYTVAVLQAAVEEPLPINEGESLSYSGEERSRSICTSEEHSINFLPAPCSGPEASLYLGPQVDPPPPTRGAGDTDRPLSEPLNFSQTGFPLPKVAHTICV